MTDLSDYIRVVAEPQEKALREALQRERARAERAEAALREIANLDTRDDELAPAIARAALSAGSGGREPTPPRCGAQYEGRTICLQPAGHDGPHEWSEKRRGAA